MSLRSRHPRTLLAYAALPDRSIERIAEVPADAREFDREEIYRLTDVWDNNTAALFAAAAARFRWTRALEARWALRRTVDLGPGRRAWMVEQTAAAGVPVERFLRRHHRPGRGGPADPGGGRGPPPRRPERRLRGPGRRLVPARRPGLRRGRHRLRHRPGGAPPGRPPARPTVRALPSRLAPSSTSRPPPRSSTATRPTPASPSPSPPAGDPDAPWILRSQGFEHPVALAFTLDAFRHTAVPESAPGRLAFGPHLTAAGAPDPR